MSCESVEIKMKKTPVSFVSTFDGFSGYPRGVGEFMSSPQVEFEHTRWCLRIYPGGFNAESEGFLSCFLSYECFGSVRVSFKISILNQKGWKNHIFESGGVMTFSRVEDSTETDHDRESLGGETRFISLPILTNPANGIMVNDKMVIKTEMIIYGDVETVSSSEGLIHVGSPGKTRSLIDDLASIFSSQSMSDITVVAGEERFSAHKFLLSLRSEVFRAMLSSGMMEEQCNEIVITDFDSSVVKEFLRFLYTDDCRSDVLETHAEMLLAISCKYRVMGLEAICEKFLCSKLNTENVASVLVLADLYQAVHLKTRALTFLSQNAKQVVQTSGFFEMLGFELCQEVILALAESAK